jgi:CRP/FNR family cyclic AMP-dependent transcriptional regulator
MIDSDYLLQIAPWAHDLSSQELQRACEGIVSKTFRKGSYVCHRGDRLDTWTGVATGLLKVSAFSKAGKPISFVGIRSGGWIGEGAMLKGEPRQYDLVAMRDTQLAMMNQSVFSWLYETSLGFNHFLVRQFNERLGQFIALVEHQRTMGAPARLARTVAWLFNPVLYPGPGNHLDLSQEEIGLLSGLSRQSVNKALKILERENLLTIERGGITILDLPSLAQYE